MAIQLSVAIQAGGQSTRMGQDKGLIQFQGNPLTQYILDQAVDFGDETFIITNNPNEYQQFGVPLFSDIHPGLGALGGLYSAIYHASLEYCLVWACDMPFFHPQLFQHLVSLASSYDAVIPRIKKDEFTEPFRAIFNKTCLDSIKTNLEVGNLRVTSFFDKVNIRFVDWPEIERFDPRGLSFFNINTPEDLEQAQQMIGFYD